MNVIVRLEFKPAYFKGAIQLVSHHAMITNQIHSLKWDMFQFLHD